MLNRFLHVRACAYFEVNLCVVIRASETGILIIESPRSLRMSGMGEVWASLFLDESAPWGQEAGYNSSNACDHAPWSPTTNYPECGLWASSLGTSWKRTFSDRISDPPTQSPQSLDPRANISQKLRMKDRLCLHLYLKSNLILWHLLYFGKSARNGPYLHPFSNPSSVTSCWVTLKELTWI